MSNITTNTLPCPPSTSTSSATPLSSSSSTFPLITRTSRDSTSRRGLEQGEETSYEYPLAHSTSLIEVIRDEEDHIDIEAEEAAYRAFDLDDSDSSALGLSLSSRNARHKLSASLTPATTPPPTLPTNINRRNRPPSSIFSRDIWVGEEGDAEKDSSFARGVRIVGWTSVGDKRGGAYVVYDCAILTTQGTTIHVHKRYSAFLALHTTLTSPCSLSSSSSASPALPRHLRKAVPPLPPRTALAKFRPGFLEGRRKALQAWLAQVLLHPEIGGCRAVREWVMAG